MNAALTKYSMDTATEIAESIVSLLKSKLEWIKFSNVVGFHLEVWSGETLYEKIYEKDTIGNNITIKITAKLSPATWKIIITPLVKSNNHWIPPESIVYQIGDINITYGDIVIAVSQVVENPSQSVLEKIINIIMDALNNPIHYTAQATKEKWMLRGARMDGILESAVVSTTAQINPLNPDSDGDGLSDGTEQKALNGWPTSPIYEDTDRDGLNDQWELNHGLSPISSDTDEDTYTDNIDLSLIHI